MSSTSNINHLAFEQLERREMLSASPSNPEAFASRGEVIESLLESVPVLESSPFARPRIDQGALLASTSKDAPPMNVFPDNVTDPFEASFFEQRPMRAIESTPRAQELKTRPILSGPAGDLPEESPVGASSSPVRVLPEVIGRLLTNESGVQGFTGQVSDRQVTPRDAFVAYEFRIPFESLRNAALGKPPVNDVVIANIFGTPTPNSVPFPARWLTARLETEGLLDVSSLTGRRTGSIPNGTNRTGISPFQRMASYVDFNDIALPNQIVLETVQTPAAFSIEVVLMPSHSIAQPSPNHVQRAGELSVSALSGTARTSDLPLSILGSWSSGPLPHDVLFGENLDHFDSGFITISGTGERSVDFDSTGRRETQGFMRPNQPVRENDGLPLVRFWERTFDPSVARATRLTDGDESRRRDIASDTESTGSSAGTFRRLALELPDNSSGGGMVAITSTDRCLSPNAPPTAAADMQMESDRLPIEVAGVCGRVRAFDVEAVAAEQTAEPHAEEPSRDIEPMAFGSSSKSADAVFSEEPQDDRHREAAILPGMFALFAKYWHSKRARRSCKSRENRVPKLHST